MKKTARRLNLSRETLIHLNLASLPEGAADLAGAAGTGTTCFSPFCAPTLQVGCRG